LLLPPPTRPRSSCFLWQGKIQFLWSAAPTLRRGSDGAQKGTRLRSASAEALDQVYDCIQSGTARPGARSDLGTDFPLVWVDPSVRPPQSCSPSLFQRRQIGVEAVSREVAHTAAWETSLPTTGHKTMHSEGENVSHRLASRPWWLFRQQEDHHSQPSLMTSPASTTVMSPHRTHDVPNGRVCSSNVFHGRSYILEASSWAENELQPFRSGQAKSIVGGWWNSRGGTWSYVGYGRSCGATKIWAKS
jgi:hypothetical protein